MRHTLELSYKTDTGKNRVIRILNPSATLTGPTISSAASRFITANPFNDEIGALTELNKVERVYVTRTVIVGD